MSPLQKYGHELLYVTTIGIGLPVSAHVGELPVNLLVCGTFLCLFFFADKFTRTQMLAVLGFATPMELFFSETWKIYEYQRGFMPLYVPCGHWFVFDLGQRIAARYGLAQRSLALSALVPFVPLTLYMAYTGVDTSGLVLLALMLGFVLLGPAPLLYAVMGWLALAMELWGTHCGVWAWARNVPWTGLTAWNPPILVGAFYGFGDMLVNMAAGEREADARAARPKRI